MLKLARTCFSKEQPPRNRQESSVQPLPASQVLLQCQQGHRLPGGKQARWVLPMNLDLHREVRGSPEFQHCARGTSKLYLVTAPGISPPPPPPGAMRMRLTMPGSCCCRWLGLNCDSIVTFVAFCEMFPGADAPLWLLKFELWPGYLPGRLLPAELSHFPLVP